MKIQIAYRMEWTRACLLLDYPFSPLPQTMFKTCVSCGQYLSLRLQEWGTRAEPPAHAAHHKDGQAGM